MQKGVLNEDEGKVEDMVFWFVSHNNEDVWFAHAVSSEADSKTADEAADTIPGGEMHVMLALGGQPWNLISAHPTQHARSQRHLLHAVTEGGQMESLLKKTVAEVRELRSEGEGTNSPSMN